MQQLFKLGCVSLALTTCQLASANEFYSSDRQWLFGDWNGQRQQLEDQGYKFNVSIMSQAATNLSGGYNDDSDFENAAQLTLGANFDLSKIAGWQDTTAALAITKRDGNAVTLERIKDPRASTLGNSQEIYGRGKIWRLTQAWIKKGFDDNALQLKFGRMGMSEDFNGSQCEFQNLILCGGQLGKSIGSIWYNWPVSVWGANANINLHQIGQSALGATKLILIMSKPTRTVMVLTLIWTMLKVPPFLWNWHGNQNWRHSTAYQANIKSVHYIPLPMPIISKQVRWKMANTASGSMHSNN